MVTGTIHEYISTVTDNYIRYRSEFVQMLSKYVSHERQDFQSPLNFIMIKRDFDTFFAEYLRCYSRMKYGFQFLKRSLIHNSVSLTRYDPRKWNYDLAYKMF